MNSLQVQRALRHIQGQTIGVFPADKIPLVWEKPCALVANVDESTKPGSHWIAIYVDSSGNGVFFDSYGLPPAVSHHIDRIRRNCRFYEWNIQQLQSIDSDVCGHFCIDFLFYMSCGYTLPMFTTLFSSYDTVRNDKLAVSLYNNITKHRKFHTSNKIKCDLCNQSCSPKTLWCVNS